MHNSSFAYAKRKEKYPKLIYFGEGGGGGGVAIEPYFCNSVVIEGTILFFFLLPNTYTNFIEAYIHNKTATCFFFIV